MTRGTRHTYPAYEINIYLLKMRYIQKIHLYD